MKDAQREINKRWSQTLNLINNQVQPGLYAEMDAFVDRDQAIDSIKTPGDVTFLQNGAIAKKQIQERSVPQFPTASFNLEEQAQIMLRRITGINPDLLGQDRGRQEPGIVVKMRQQQGMTILRPLFASYKKMKRELFKRQVAIILRWMPIQQMQKILGAFYQFIIKNGEIWVSNPEGNLAFNLEKIRDVEYIIDVEETSASMTQRMFELQAMTEMQTAGIPADPLIMINKMDLPETEKQHWIQYVSQQQEAASQAAQAEIQLKQTELQLKHQRESLKIILEHQAKTDKTMAQMAKDAANIKAYLDEIAITNKDVEYDFIAKLAAISQQDEASKRDAAAKRAGGKSNETKN
jgi:hypothetical protein